MPSKKKMKKKEALHRRLAAYQGTMDPSQA